MSEDRDTCFQAGMDAYATKPLRAEELFHTLEQATAHLPDISSDSPPDGLPESLPPLPADILAHSSEQNEARSTAEDNPAETSSADTTATA